MPGVYDEVERAARIRFKALDADGKPYEKEAEGLLAVCVQHELDHLDGKVFVEYLSPLEAEPHQDQAAQGRTRNRARGVKTHPRSAARFPSRGRRWRTGEAGSAASAIGCTCLMRRTVMKLTPEEWKPSSEAPCASLSRRG